MQDPSTLGDEPICLNITDGTYDWHLSKLLADYNQHRKMELRQFGRDIGPPDMEHFKEVARLLAVATEIFREGL
jgi:hypothetical protein